MMQNLELNEKIKAFIDERVEKFKTKIPQNDPKTPENDKVGILFHLIPLSSFENNSAIDIDSLKKNGDFKLDPIGTEFKFTQYERGVDIETELNKDGISRFAPKLSREPTVQLFRNLSIEGSYLTSRKCTNKEKNLRLKDIRERLDNSITQYIAFIRKYNQDPVKVSLIILNLSGYCIGLDEHCQRFSVPTNSSKLEFPHIEIGPEIKGDFLTPLYRVLYNVFGKTYDPNLPY